MRSRRDRHGGRVFANIGEGKRANVVPRKSQIDRNYREMSSATSVTRSAIAALALVVAGGTNSFAAGFPWKSFAAMPDEWYRTEEAARIAANVLSHQSERGDWPKNLDTSAAAYRGDRSQLHGTFDNGATVGEMRFLARAFDVTGRTEYRDAFIKALDHVLAAQYANGGWPQTYPPGKGYARHITFNDGTMVNLLELVRDVARSNDFRFVESVRRDSAERAFTAGIACILKCQINVNGRLTVWCAQHEENTLEPRGARTYELASLSGMESAGILMLLMSLENPSAEVIRAVRACAVVRGRPDQRHPASRCRWR